MSKRTNKNKLQETAKTVKNTKKQPEREPNQEKQPREEQQQSPEEQKGLEKNMPDITSRAWEVVTYPEFLPQERLEKALEHKVIKRWAWILHDKDVYTEDDAEHNRIPEGSKVGDPRPAHLHVEIDCGKRPTSLSEISRWFEMPANFIHKVGGKFGFMDMVQYITHEREEQQALGKYNYPDEEIHADFNFREAINEMIAMKAEFGKPLTPKERMQYDVQYKGKSLRRCEQEDPLLFMQCYADLAKRREDYINRRAKLPKVRVNFYLCGKGGVGKDTMAMALARSIYPELPDEELFFMVGSGEAAFMGYDGQPVIIWPECRSGVLKQMLKGRAGVFAIFDNIPKSQMQNRKYGAVKLLNAVNIVHSPQPYVEFLEDLCHKWGAEDGAEKEPINQATRRFPIIIPIADKFFDIVLNKGYIENDHRYFEEYIEYKRISGSLGNIARKLGDSEQSRKLQALMVKPANDIYQKIKNMTPQEPEELNKEMQSILAEGCGKELSLRTGKFLKEEEIKEKEKNIWKPTYDELLVQIEQMAKELHECNKTISDLRESNRDLFAACKNSGIFDANPDDYNCGYGYYHDGYIDGSHYDDFYDQEDYRADRYELEEVS